MRNARRTPPVAGHNLWGATQQNAVIADSNSLADGIPRNTF